MTTLSDRLDNPDNITEVEAADISWKWPRGSTFIPAFPHHDVSRLLVVERSKKGRGSFKAAYRLLAGAADLDGVLKHAARLERNGARRPVAGPLHVKVLVVDWATLTPLEKQGIQLRALYRGSMPPELVGSAFDEWLRTARLSQTQAARHMGITSSSIAHYRAVATKLDPALLPLLTEGKLTFKMARFLAPIPGYGRQRDLATQFTAGLLTSSDVDQLAGVVKAYPSWSGSMYSDEMRRLRNGGHSRLHPEENGHSEVKLAAPLTPVADFSGLEADMLRVAGLLDALGLAAPIPEYQRLKLASHLDVLIGRAAKARARLGGTGQLARNGSWVLRR